MTTHPWPPAGAVALALARYATWERWPCELDEEPFPLPGRPVPKVMRDRLWDERAEEARRRIDAGERIKAVAKDLGYANPDTLRRALRQRGLWKEAAHA